MKRLRRGVHAQILRRLRAPRLAHHGSPSALGLDAQALRLPAAGGKTLFAWFVPALGAGPAPAVVVMHGWGANASLMLPAAAPLHAAGFAVLLVDARCHGASDDEDFTSLPRFAEDIETGLDWLGQQPGVDGARLAIMGHSVGAGAALLCAARRADVRAVVSLSAFAHPREVMRRFLAEAHIPYPLLGWYVLRHVQRVIGVCFDEIAPLTSMRRIRCPVLLVHGTHDEVVPFDDARRLQAAGLSGMVQCLSVAGGHDPSRAMEANFPQLIDFLQRSLHAIHPHRQELPMKNAHDLVTAAKLRIDEVALDDAEQAIREADVLLDVREADEYAAGHLVGAIHASRGVLEFKLSSTPELSSRDLKIVLYCKTGGRAALAACALHDMAYLQVKSIAGGFDAWAGAGKSVVKPTAPTFE